MVNSISFTTILCATGVPNEEYIHVGHRTERFYEMTKRSGKRTMFPTVIQAVHLIPPTLHAGEERTTQLSRFL